MPTIHPFPVLGQYVADPKKLYELGVRVFGKRQTA